MKKLILLCALCLFGAGVVFGQAYSDLLYRDWAGLRAYAQVNKTLGDVRPDVVFMGNSITEGWFNQHPEFFQKNNFLGRGIGGQTSSEMLVRFRQDVIELHPQCVAIMAGTNDIAMNNGYIAPGKYLPEHRFDVRAGALQRDKGAAVLRHAVRALQLGGRRWSPGRSSLSSTRCSGSMRTRPRAWSMSTISRRWPTRTTPCSRNIRPRGCHPNGEGYKVMEKIIVPAINKVNGTDKNYFVY